MSNKCVYVHKDSNGVIRYVGSGSIGRAYRTETNSDRGKQYSDFVKANGKLEVEIVVEGLSKIEAEEIERKLYDKYKDTALNARRPYGAKIMIKEMFEEHLYYDETSKSCLRWKTDRVSGNNKIERKANSEAGSLSKSVGYYQVRVQGKIYLAHRIIALLYDLEVNNKVVDHKDRNRLNNKISNLRVVSEKENSQNLSQQKLSSRNTSGVQGVSFNSKGYWFASWMQEGKQKIKIFPIKNYPSPEQSFNAAVEYRQQMVKLHYANRRSSDD